MSDPIDEGATTSADDELLTSAEAARRLKMSPNAFRKWRRRRGIPNRLDHRRLRVRAGDLVRPDALITLQDYRDAGRAFARTGVLRPRR
jgi:hypothetical protein